MLDKKHTSEMFGKPREVHPYAWLWEPIEDQPTFVLRTMFGSKAVYLHGLMMLCFSAGEEPWRGLLVCTDQERQPGLIADFPSLRPHSILPKWLYLPESSADFESCAAKIVALARVRDPRLGVLPGTRQRKRKARIGASKPRVKGRAPGGTAKRRSRL
jgi:hypothetical protein